MRKYLLHVRQNQIFWTRGNRSLIVGSTVMSMI